MANFIPFDTETRSKLDLTVCGTLNYVLDPSTEILLVSWASDIDDIIKLWCPDLSDRLVPEVWAYVRSRVHHWGEKFPAPFLIAAASPSNYWVAWNAGFDRAVMQQIGPDYGLPRMEVERFLCAQAQAQASNLPGSLDMAGRAFDLGQKTVGGKAVMKAFADANQPLPGSEEWIAARPDRSKALKDAMEMWDLYLTYGSQDTNLMRDLWKTTRPLDAEEWAEYWAHERINDRGMVVDTEFCAAAVRYKDEETEYVIERCKELTDGAIQGPTFSAKITQWVYERLPEALSEVMVKSRDKETGEPVSLTLDKNTIVRLLEDIQWYEAPPEDNVVEFLELMQYARSTSASKFQKMLDQVVEDDNGDYRLTYSYTFNGAGQTGRFSSRGVQIHNLPNKKVPNELDVMDMIVAGTPIEQLRDLPLEKDDIGKNQRPKTSVSQLLGRLIRPAFMAPKDKMLVWCDWSAIEARVTPWLSDSREADVLVLDIFRQTDADKDKPDIYVANAASIFNVPAEDIWSRYLDGDPQGKSWRQGGKIAVLALGFLGGEGALSALARSYGLRFTSEEKKIIVNGWRDRNRWARRFGNKAEEAAFAAMNHPGLAYKAGRLFYCYYPDLMGGTLVCTLPCGRLLCYPMARIATIERFGEDRETITYLNGMGRSIMWPGKLLENATQGYAASLLRGTLLRIDREWDPDVAMSVGDTHDEIITEAPAADAEATGERLREIMTRGFDHTTGLPLAAEVEIDWYYHK